MVRARVLIVIAVVLAVSQFASARSHRGGHGGAMGFEGTVGELNGNSFTLVAKDSKNYVIVCDNNTRFTEGGQPVAPSKVTGGTTVRVQGSINNLTIQATAVNIGGGTKKKGT